MIEVQCDFILKMEEVETIASELFLQGKTEIFPELKWNGRIQQKIVGHSQQSVFSITTAWDDLKSWEKEYQNAFLSKKFVNWYSGIYDISKYGGNWIVSKILEPYTSANNESGIIEIQSSYVVKFKNINKAIKLMEDALKQKILKGHCSQRIFGPDAQTLFTWSSFWDSFSKWEKGIYERPKNEFLISEAWFAKWTKVIDFGGPKEVFRNL